MQNMHPGLGAGGVEEHSQFFDERWERLYRSLYPIAGVVFDGDRAQQTAEEVRGYHTRIKGVDKLGRRYHALDPDTFYWAHATFFMGTIVTAENFSGGLTEAQKRQLFTEHIQWYRLYGMSMRLFPRPGKHFRSTGTHVPQRTRRQQGDPRRPRPVGTRQAPPVHDVATRSVVAARPNPPLARGFVWLTVGMYDQPVRDLLGYSWTSRDQKIHNAVGRTVNAVFRLVPWRYRYQPRARAGWDRADGRIPPADAPLVHTPARNLPPPLEQRDNPMHYSPPRV